MHNRLPNFNNLEKKFSELHDSTRCLKRIIVAKMALSYWQWTHFVSPTYRERFDPHAVGLETDRWARILTSWASSLMQCPTAKRINYQGNHKKSTRLRMTAMSKDTQLNFVIVAIRFSCYPRGQLVNTSSYHNWKMKKSLNYNLLGNDKT